MYVQLKLKVFEILRLTFNFVWHKAAAVNSLQPGLGAVGVLAPLALRSQSRHELPSVDAICLCVATDPPQRQQC